MKKGMIAGFLILALVVVGIAGWDGNYAVAQEAKEGELPQLTSVKQLKDMIKEAPARYTMITESVDMAAMEDAAPAATNDGVSSKSVSQTNTQVSGVDEGDLVKTDGDYLYSIQENLLRIYQLDGMDVQMMSKVDAGNTDLRELYISGDRLVTIASKYVGGEIVPYNGNSKMEMRYWPIQSFAVYTVYDIADRSKPEMVKSFEVEGDSLSTRLIGNQLYFIANKSLWYYAYDGLTPEILPVYRDDMLDADSYCTIPVTDIYYFPGQEEADSYLNVGMIRLDDDSPAVFDSYLSAGNLCYMNPEHLYIVKSQWDYADGNSTKIYQFDISAAGVSYRGEGSVSGTLINQYSMDEWNGVFRIATHTANGNLITTFDENLKQLGQTPALAPDELIYSARFMGNMGYLVTYKQVDPLFSIDLSDPTNPKVLDALKIPGYSQYLHPISDQLLVGFGRHTTESYVKDLSGKEVSLGVVDMGAKVSLFDISDSYQLKELDVLLLGEDTYASAFTNPKSFLVDSERQLFGFYLDNYTYDADVSQIILVAVRDNKLVKYKLDQPKKGWYNSNQARLIYVDDILYSVYGESVTAYDLTTIL